MAFRPAIFDADILAFEIAGLPKSVAKRSQIGGRFRWRTRTQETDYRHCLLLRSKRERPSGSCSCNRCDEFASLHCSLKPRLQCLKTARLQQGFATSEMGVWVKLHRSSSEPLMSALGQKQT